MKSSLNCGHLSPFEARLKSHFLLVNCCNDDGVKFNKVFNDFDSHELFTCALWSVVAYKL